MNNPLNKKIHGDKWHTVSIDAYKIVYDLAKERLDETLSESQSITDKSIKMISSLVVFSGFFFGYLLSNKELIAQNRCLLIFLGVIVISNMIFLVDLIWPKMVKSKGLPPNVSLVDDFDDEEDSPFQTQLVYYNSLKIIQSNIDYMDGKNSDRHLFYKVSLSLFLFIAGFMPYVFMSII